MSRNEHLLEKQQWKSRQWITIISISLAEISYWQNSYYIQSWKGEIALATSIPANHSSEKQADSNSLLATSPFFHGGLVLEAISRTGNGATRWFVFSSWPLHLGSSPLC